MNLKVDLDNNNKDVSTNTVADLGDQWDHLLPAPVKIIHKKMAAA